MKNLLRSIVEHGVNKGAEFVDVRVQNTTGTFVRVVDKKTKEILNSNEKGVGIRAFSGGAWGFACTNNLNKTSLIEAVEVAVKMAKAAKKRAKIKFKLNPPGPFEDKIRIPARRKLLDISVEEKVKYTLNLNKTAFSVDKRVVSVSTAYEDLTGLMISCNSIGTYIETQINYILALGVAYATEEGVRQRGVESIGGSGGFEHLETEKASEIGKNAAEKAIRLLKAESPPAGKFYCIFDPDLAGLFIHEAFGHACEADSVLAGASILEGKIGEHVGSDIVTAIDNPTIEGLYGSYQYDSEGTPSKPKLLIDRGVLRGFMHDIETASRMSMEANGSARTSGYQSPPIVRMSNTYIAPGEWTFEEMLEDVKEGIYAKGLSYGYTEPAKGQFMFKCEEAYLIEGGRLTKYLRDAALSGLILEVLKNTDAIGKDVEYKPGNCGKGGQLAMITSGGPHIRIKDIVFGGTV